MLLTRKSDSAPTSGPRLRRLAGHQAGFGVDRAPDVDQARHGPSLLSGCCGGQVGQQVIGVLEADRDAQHSG